MENREWRIREKRIENKRYKRYKKYKTRDKR